MPLTGDPSKDIPELKKTGRPFKQILAIVFGSKSHEKKEGKSQDKSVEKKGS